MGPFACQRDGPQRLSAVERLSELAAGGWQLHAIGNICPRPFAVDSYPLKVARTRRRVRFPMRVLKSRQDALLVESYLTWHVMLTYNRSTL